jgi:hypothetical protein
MPATYVTNHLRSRAERRAVDFDIDNALNVVDLGQPQGAGNECLPLVDGYRRFLAGLFHSVGTGLVTKFQIIAATAADGTGATIVVEHALASAPDAVGDLVWLECDVEQVHEVLPTATHVGVRVQLATATDEAVVFFQRAEPQWLGAPLTADYVS